MAFAVRRVVATTTSSSSSQTPTLPIKRASGGNNSEWASLTAASIDRSSPRANEIISKLTINKLRLESIGIYGRSKEIEFLKTRLNRQIDQSSADDGDGHKNRNKDLILITGDSGVGKTSLAKVLIKDKMVCKAGIYASGKFNLNNINSPFSAISMAYGEIFQRIFSTMNNDNGSTVAKKIEDAIISELKTEMDLLSDFIPEFDKIGTKIGKNGANLKMTNDINSSMTDRSNLEAMNERVKYAFRELTRILTSFFSPFVVMLDDLQWADLSTLDLIDSLLNDTQNSNPLMIIGCYRSNEVNDTHILSSTIRRIKEKKNEFTNLEVSEVHIGNLGVHEVNQVIMALLSIDEEARTMSLAEICFKRSNGSPFFLLEFVKILEKYRLLRYNLGSFQWEWSAAEIEEKTMSTANIVDLLKEKMKQLPKESQTLLKHAACLGSSFRIGSIRHICEKQINSDIESAAIDEEPMLELLSFLVEEQFIERQGPSTYRWVHDKIQESALALVGGEKLVTFQYNVGVAWYQNIRDDDELDSCLFNIVNLINKAHCINPEFAELNLRAAMKAMDISAFASVANYILRGIDFLPADKWLSHRLLTLQLYSIGAEVEGFLGRREGMNAYCNEVLAQENCSTLDKLRVHVARLESLSGQKKHNEVIKESLIVLEALDCKFPRTSTAGSLRGLLSIISAVKAYKNITAEEFESLPEAMDQREVAVMKLLSRLSYSSIFSGNFFLFSLAVTRGVQMTISGGVCTASPMSLIWLGILAQNVLNDFDTASYFARMAVRIQEKHKMHSEEGVIIQMASNFVFCWTEPLQTTCIRSSLKGYRSAMRSGNIESAMWNLMVIKVVVPFVSGKPLNTIEADCPAAVALMEELKQEDPAGTIRLFWQVSLNLMGRSDRTTMLIGEALDEDQLIASIDRHSLQYAALVSAKNIVCNFFGEFELGAELAIQKEKDNANKQGHFLAMLHTFHRGVSLYAMARRTKKRRFKRFARKPRRLINSWLEKGNPNVKHYSCLLNAEHAALVRNNNLAKREYEESIVLSVRCGFLHDAALANERYADFLIHQMSDKEEGRYRLMESIRLYQEWGADRKVEQLRKEHGI